MKDLSTMGVLRGPGLQMRDSAGRPLGPARMGSIPVAGPNLMVRPGSSAPRQSTPSPAEQALAEAKKNLDKVQISAIQIHRTFDELSSLIGQEAAVAAAEQAADALDSASRRHEEAKRKASGIHRNITTF